MADVSKLIEEAQDDQLIPFVSYADEESARGRKVLNEYWKGTRKFRTAPVGEVGSYENQIFQQHRQAAQFEEHLENYKGESEFGITNLLAAKAKDQWHHWHAIGGFFNRLMYGGDTDAEINHPQLVWSDEDVERVTTNIPFDKWDHFLKSYSRHDLERKFTAFDKKQELDSLWAYYNDRPNEDLGEGFGKWWRQWGMMWVDPGMLIPYIGGAKLLRAGVNTLRAGTLAAATTARVGAQMQNIKKASLMLPAMGMGAVIDTTIAGALGYLMQQENPLFSNDEYLQYAVWVGIFGTAFGGLEGALALRGLQGAATAARAARRKHTIATFDRFDGQEHTLNMFDYFMKLPEADREAFLRAAREDLDTWVQEHPGGVVVAGRDSNAIPLEFLQSLYEHHHLKLLETETAAKGILEVTGKYGKVAEETLEIARKNGRTDLLEIAEGLIEGRLGRVTSEEAKIIDKILDGKAIGLNAEEMSSVLKFPKKLLLEMEKSGDGRARLLEWASTEREKAVESIKINTERLAELHKQGRAETNVAEDTISFITEDGLVSGRIIKVTDTEITVRPLKVERQRAELSDLRGELKEHKTKLDELLAPKKAFTDYGDYGTSTGRYLKSVKRWKKAGVTRIPKQAVDRDILIYAEGDLKIIKEIKPGTKATKQYVVYNLENGKWVKDSAHKTQTDAVIYADEYGATTAAPAAAPAPAFTPDSLPKVGEKVWITDDSVGVAAGVYRGSRSNETKTITLHRVELEGMDKDIGSVSRTVRDEEVSTAIFRTESEARAARDAADSARAAEQAERSAANRAKDPDWTAEMEADYRAGQDATMAQVKLRHARIEPAAVRPLKPGGQRGRPRAGPKKSKAELVEEYKEVIRRAREGQGTEHDLVLLREIRAELKEQGSNALQPKPYEGQILTTDSTGRSRNMFTAGGSIEEARRDIDFLLTRRWTDWEHAYERWISKKFSKKAELQSEVKPNELLSREAAEAEAYSEMIHTRDLYFKSAKAKLRPPAKTAIHKTVELPKLTIKETKLSMQVQKARMPNQLGAWEITKNGKPLPGRYKTRGAAQDKMGALSKEGLTFEIYQDGRPTGTKAVDKEGAEILKKGREAKFKEQEAEYTRYEIERNGEKQPLKFESEEDALQGLKDLEGDLLREEPDAFLVEAPAKPVVTPTEVTGLDPKRRTEMYEEIKQLYKESGDLSAEEIKTRLDDVIRELGVGEEAGALQSLRDNLLRSQELAEEIKFADAFTADDVTVNMAEAIKYDFSVRYAPGAVQKVTPAVSKWRNSPKAIKKGKEQLEWHGTIYERDTRLQKIIYNDGTHDWRLTWIPKDGAEHVLRTFKQRGGQGARNPVDLRNKSVEEATSAFSKHIRKSLLQDIESTVVHDRKREALNLFQNAEDAPRNFMRMLNKEGQIPKELTDAFGDFSITELTRIIKDPITPPKQRAQARNELSRAVSDTVEPAAPGVTPGEPPPSSVLTSPDWQPIGSDGVPSYKRWQKWAAGYFDFKHDPLFMEGPPAVRKLAQVILGEWGVPYLEGVPTSGTKAGTLLSGGLQPNLRFQTNAMLAPVTKALKDGRTNFFKALKLTGHRKRWGDEEFNRLVHGAVDNSKTPERMVWPTDFPQEAKDVILKAGKAIDDHNYKTIKWAVDHGLEEFKPILDAIGGPGGYFTKMFDNMNIEKLLTHGSAEDLRKLIAEGIRRDQPNLPPETLDLISRTYLSYALDIKGTRPVLDPILGPRGEGIEQLVDTLDSIFRNTNGSRSEHATYAGFPENMQKNRSKIVKALKKSLVPEHEEGSKRAMFRIKMDHNASVKMKLKDPKTGIIEERDVFLRELFLSDPMPVLSRYTIDIVNSAQQKELLNLFKINVGGKQVPFDSVDELFSAMRWGLQSGAGGKVWVGAALDRPLELLRNMAQNKPIFVRNELNSMAAIGMQGATAMKLPQFTKAGTPEWAMAEAAIGIIDVLTDNIPILGRYIRDMKGGRASKEDIRHFLNFEVGGGKTEGWISDQFANWALTSEGDPLLAGKAGTLHNKLTAGTHMMSKVSLYRPMNERADLAATRHFITMLVRAARGNKKMGAKLNDARIAQLGYVRDDVDEIFAALRKDGVVTTQEVRGIGDDFIINWDLLDPTTRAKITTGARAFLRQIVQRSSRSDLPKWALTSGIASLFTQFRAFMISSMANHFARNIQAADSIAMSNIISMAFGGTMVHLYKTYARFWDDPQTLREELQPHRIAAGALLYSGFMGMLPDIIDTGLYYGSGGEINAFFSPGDAPLTFRMPVADFIKSEYFGAKALGQTLLDGRMTKQRAYQLKNAFPGASIVYIEWISDLMRGQFPKK